MKFKSFLFVLLGFASGLFAQRPASHLLDSNHIKTLYFSGLREKLNEDYNKANQIFNEILVLSPNNAAVHYEIAIVNYRQNKLYEAEAAIKKATALEADNIWYWMMSAELYKRKGDMDAMASVLSQLIRLSPERIDFYFDRSNAFLLAGKPAEALNGYNELEKKFGLSDELAKARKRLTLAEHGKSLKIEVTEGHVENSSAEPAAESRILLAESLYKKGDLEGALSQFKSILESTERPYKAWEQALNIQLLLAHYKDAIKTADEALSIYPNQAILYYFMALALHKEHQNQLALKNVKFALELDAENGVYLELYGDILFLKGDAETAILQWKKARAAGNETQKLKKKINERKYLE